MKLRNVVFPGPDGSAARANQLWEVNLVDGVVEAVNAIQDSDDHDDGDVASQLLLPALCHPHLHLDKTYLLTGCGAATAPGDPDYADLLPRTGSFAEALQTTAAAKARFTETDLYRRGLQLLATSCAYGVASARVFVEVDAQAAGRGAVAVAVAAALQTRFRGRMVLQVCAFAQEVLFSGAAGVANRAAMESVLADDQARERRTIAVLGTTPYVEATRAHALQNIDWAVATALRYDLHLDFYLDYNLRPVPSSEGPGADDDADDDPLIFAVVAALVRHGWRDHTARTVVVGHATRLTCLPPARLAHLAASLQAHGLRSTVHFVGLPTSDLYMMGRSPPTNGDGAAAPLPPLAAPRGTLPVTTLVRHYGLGACLGINNVGNAFTPYGTADPLQLACWGVGLYHAGTGADARLLYGCVSWRARQAIGMETDDDDVGSGGIHWDGTDNGSNAVDCLADHRTLVGRRLGPVLVVENPMYMRLRRYDDGHDRDDRIPARPRLGFRDTVWDPPDVSLRRLVC